MYAYACLIAGLEQDPLVLQCLPDFVRDDPNLSDLVRSLAGDPTELGDDRLRQLASALALIIALATVSGHALLVARTKPVEALRYE